MRYGGSYERDYIDKARDYQALHSDPDLRDFLDFLAEKKQAMVGNSDRMNVASKRKIEPQKNLARLIVGVGYSGCIGLVIGLITGNVALALSGAVAVGVDLLLVLVLKKILKNKHTNLEKLIDEHVNWLKLVFQKFHLFIKNRDYARTSASSHGKKRAWDVQLVVSFARELTVVFPEEWDEWQHWISDIIDSRTRMQSKGMNHRIVSLITFHRLARFAFHIGIGKVFILATCNKVKKK